MRDFSVLLLRFPYLQQYTLLFYNNTKVDGSVISRHLASALYSARRRARFLFQTYIDLAPYTGLWQRSRVDGGSGRFFVRFDYDLWRFRLSMWKCVDEGTFGGNKSSMRAHDG